MRLSRWKKSVRPSVSINQVYRVNPEILSSSHAQYLSKCPSISQPLRSSETSSFQFLAFGLAAVGMSMISFKSNHTALEATDEEDLDIKAAIAVLKETLAPFRERQLRTHGRKPPSIKMGVDHHDIIQIRFSYPAYVDSLELVQVFLQHYGREEMKIVPNHETREHQLEFQSLEHDLVLRLEHAAANPGNRTKDFAVYKKCARLSRSEIHAIAESYEAAFSSGPPPNRLIMHNSTPQFNSNAKPNEEPLPQSKEEAIDALEKLGIRVFQPAEDGTDALDWNCMAGYEETKQEIQDTLLLPLQNPGIYDDIVKQTRQKFESNRPRSILLEGPPGTGKTLTCKIIAQKSGLPMIHLPVESIVSKWYGESEKNMSLIFDACSQLDGAILFIDEIDALAGDRGSGNMHEASRRILSVLLQKIEGFDSAQKTTLVCATNRKQDLDAAMLSRFGLTIQYDLPSEVARQGIFHRYAKQLTNSDLAKLAQATWGLSCRDIKEICEHTERRWASKYLRQETLTLVPHLDAYLKAAEYRVAGLDVGPDTHPASPV